MAASDMSFFPDAHSKACGLPLSELQFCQQYVVSKEPPKSWALDPPKAYPERSEKSNYEDEELSIARTSKCDNLERRRFYEFTESVRPISVASMNNEVFESSPCSTYRADYIEYPMLLSKTPVNCKPNQPLDVGPEDVQCHCRGSYPSCLETPEPVWHSQAFQYPVATESSHCIEEHKPLTAFKKPAQPIDCSECQALCGVHDMPESIYTTDFVPHEIRPRSSFRQSSFLIQEATEPMEDKSCYRLDYPPWSDEPRKSMKPKEVYIPSVEKLASNTSYQIDFPAREGSVVTKPFQPICNQWFPTGGRTGISNYKEEFISRPAEKIHSMKPQQVYVPPDKRMDDTTVYRSDYGHKTADQQQSFTPKIQYHPPSGPFVAITTYTEDFQKRHGERSRNCRPTERYSKPTQRMSDTTCYMNDFRAFSCDRAVPCQFHPEYVPPFGRFVDETTYRTDFTKKVVDKSEKIIPKDNLVVTCAGKLNRLPTYKSEFCPFHLGQKHKTNWNSSKSLQDADKHTTYKTAERTPSFYPRYDLQHSSGRVAENTTHQAPQGNQEQPAISKGVCCLSKGRINSSTSYMTNFLPPGDVAINHQTQPGTLRPATSNDWVRGLQAAHTRTRNRSLSESSRSYSALREIERQASVLETKKLGQRRYPLTCSKCHNPVARRLEMTKDEVSHANHESRSHKTSNDIYGHCPRGQSGIT